ncbi:unnamed protein product [Brassica oleracea var. botrytis]
MGSMYTAVLFLGLQNAASVQPVVNVERTVFYREQAAGMYSAMPYAFAQVFIEMPYVLVQAVVYGLVVYAMIGFEWTAAKFFCDITQPMADGTSVKQFIRVFYGFREGFLGVVAAITSSSLSHLLSYLLLESRLSISKSDEQFLLLYYLKCICLAFYLL